MLGSQGMLSIPSSVISMATELVVVALWVRSVGVSGDKGALSDRSCSITLPDTEWMNTRTCWVEVHKL